MEYSPMFFKSWMYKQIMVYPKDGLLLGYKKEPTTDTWEMDLR